MATYYNNDFVLVLCQNHVRRRTLRSSTKGEFVKPGKGEAFARVKLRRLLTGTRVEKTFKSTDSAEGADVVDMNLTSTCTTTVSLALHEQ